MFILTATMRAKALYTFPGTKAKHLSFNKDDIIEDVVEKSEMWLKVTVISIVSGSRFYVGGQTGQDIQSPFLAFSQIFLLRV